MTALRIVHLLACPTLTGPGAAAVPMILATRDAGAEINVFLDGLRPDNLARLLKNHGVHTDESLSLSTIAPAWKTLRDVQQLRRIFKKNPPDALVMHTSHDHIIGWLSTRGLSKHVPLIRTLHSKRSLQPRLGQRWLWNHTDAVVCHVRQWEDVLHETFGFPLKKVHFTPQPMENTSFSPVGNDLRSQFGIPKETPVLGVVARIKPGRRLFTLLAAMHSVGHSLGLHLMVVGTGESAETLKTLCHHWRLEENVHFTGYLHGNLLPSAYRAMDALLLAAEGNDGSCRMISEAALSGVPVIGFSGIEAVREQVVPDRTGKWFDVAGNSAYAWRSAFENVFRMFVQENEWYEYGEQARTKCLESPTAKTIGGKWLEFLETL